MKFNSTRGKVFGISAAEAIKWGLASDGGLFMPESIPHLTTDEFDSLLRMDYCERAAFIIGKFLTDYTYEELIEDARAAYSPDKFTPSPAPVSRFSDRVRILELWHGPTSAFKDMALQIMPRLFSRALKKTNEDKTALILVATSGDTGKAALEGYRDVCGTKIQVFYPTDGVSRIQKLQMQTQEGENVSVLGIRGNFDDAQSAVKRIFSSSDMAKDLSERGIFLSSANSINWGRLVPQIVYYVSAYCDMVNAKDVSFGEKIDVCVPTGNFGNIFAAYIARLMGTPIEKLICASNSNNVLTEFFNTATYNRERKFIKTISPSMDILISSNLERLIYLVCGADKCCEYMRGLAEGGGYTLAPEDMKKINDVFIGFYADEDATSRTIKDAFENRKCLIDTHTAVAVNSAEQYMRTYEAERKVLVVSTASPYKFAKDVYNALVPTPEHFEDDLLGVAKLQGLSGTAVPTPLANITEKAILHRDIINKGDMDSAVLDFAR